MKILNFGSLNIDKVYSVDEFVCAGQTIASMGMDTFAGGKGLNQSVALARAGAEAYHAGCIGADGDMLRQVLEQSGANTKYLRVVAGAPSGHALIQVTSKGENCIIVHSGSNGMVDTAFIDKVLADFAPGDFLLLQNEISNVGYAMEAGKKAGLTVVFNPSPITPELLEYPLGNVDIFLLNETEGQLLSGVESKDYDTQLDALEAKFPGAAFVLTVGKNGVLYRKGDVRASHGIYDVPVADTTAAGDTFTGFFLASLAKGDSPARALELASIASSIAVSRKGAAPSIPNMDEVLAFNGKLL